MLACVVGAVRVVQLSEALRALGSDAHQVVAASMLQAVADGDLCRVCDKELALALRQGPCSAGRSVCSLAVSTSCLWLLRQELEGG